MYMNPYRPQVGAPPPLLVGRIDVKSSVGSCLDSVKAGVTPQSILIHGMRGVGKTALLRQLEQRVGEHGNGVVPILMEAVHWQGSMAAIVSEIGNALKKNETHLQMLGREVAWAENLTQQYITRKATGKGAETTEVIDELVKLAQELLDRKMAILLFMDELQGMQHTELEKLLHFIHMTQRDSLPFLFIVAGLPNLPGKLTRARSNAGRMFIPQKIGRLTPEQSRLALVKPAAKQGRRFAEDAMDELLRLSKGYPYFLQVWGSTLWEITDSDRFTLGNVREVKGVVMEAVRTFLADDYLSKLPAGQNDFLLALASLPLEERTYTNVASILGGKPKSHGKTRLALIYNGIIESEAKNKLDFALPMLDKILLDRQNELE